jgi:hypothetical protein
MKLPEIKKLVQQHTLAELRAAEEALLNEQVPAIVVGGDDEGEQLTHIIGAIEILESIEKGAAEKDALRAFTQRVRNSIS